MQNATQPTDSGGPAHFARCAAALGGAPLHEGSWESLHTQVLRLPPGGWVHPAGAYARLTIPLSRHGRVRRRLAGDSRDWRPGLKRRGMISLTPPGSEGEWEWLDPSHFGLLFLPDRLLRDALDEAGADKHMLLLRPSLAEHDPVVAPVFEAIQAEIGATSRASRLLVSSAALFLARHVLRRYGPPARPQRSPDSAPAACIRRVIDAIDARLGDDWSVPEMAREAGLGPFWFAHVFKAQTGVSPHRFVQQRRLARARRLLACGDLPITDVAAQCGFDSQSWFTTAFRREFAVTPAAWRRQVR